MLSLFRRGVTAKIMLVILGIGLFAIVITGFGTGGMGAGSLSGPSSGSVAEVDGEPITSVELRDMVQRQLSQMRQQRPEMDMATFLQQGALEEIADQMIDIAAAVAFGRSQGLGVSREAIDREIASIPAFHNLAGQFDQATFERALQQENLTPEGLRKEIETRMIRRQLLQPAGEWATVPQGLAFQYASLLLESRTGTVGAVPIAAMGPGREPSDQEVAAFFQQNRARYTIPERRVLRYAVFGPEQVAAAAKATDAEIAAAYQQNAAAYGARESRTLSQVVLPDEAAARAFVQKVNAGTAFAQAASQAGFGAGDIAVADQTKEGYTRMANAAVANAVWAAGKGALVGPLKGPIGWHVVRIEDVKTTAARPLESVRAELAAGIERQKAQAALGDLAGRIEDAIAGGSSFQEVVQREKLTVRETPPVTGTGAAPGNPEWQAPPELAPLLQTAFDMEPDAEPVVEQIVPNERFALLAVGGVTPAAPPPLAQIRDRVKADLIARRALDRARAVASSIVSKINAGTPPAQAFAEAQVKLPATQSVTAVRRHVAQQNRQVPPPLAMLFSLPRGKARLLAAPNGSGWFIVYLDRIVPGDAAKEPALTAAVKGQFRQVLGEEYLRQFGAAIRKKAEVERNEDALKQLKRDLAGAGAAQ
jgi:peptidyl-prolyl cis-trans isomerase D